MQILDKFYLKWPQNFFKFLKNFFGSSRNFYKFTYQISGHDF